MSYLTREDYKRAKENNIYPELAYQRFYTLGWSVEDATTKKPQSRKEGIYSLYKEKCDQIGIARDTFYGIIRRGMTPEEAATRPKQKPFGSGRGEKG